MRELDGRCSDAASHRVNQHALSRRQPALGRKGVVGCDEGFGDCGGLREVEVAGDVSDQAFVSDEVLSEPAATDNPHDTIAAFDWANDIRTDGVNFTGKFEARNVCGSTGRCRIDALALQQIGPVQAGGAYAHANLSAAGLGRRQIADFKNFRAAGAGDDDGFH
jgi:hypothetical protein